MKHRIGSHNINLRVYLILILMLFLSLLFMCFLENKRYQKIEIYLPSANRRGFSKEVRYIPRDGSRIEKVHWIVNELLSGPIGSNNLRVFNPNTKVKDIFIEKDVLYINFDWKIIETLTKNYNIAIDSIKKTIAKNIYGVKEVRLIINGVEPILYKGPIILKLK